MYFATRQVYDGVPGHLVRAMVMNGAEVEGSESSGNSHIDGGEHYNDGEEGNKNANDHEIEAAAGSLAAGMGKGVVGESRLGGLGNFAVSYIYGYYGR